MYSTIGCRRPEIILVDKRAKEAKIIDIAICGDARVKDKELEKIEKSQFLEKRNRKVVEGEVKVVPIVIEAWELYPTCLRNLTLPSDLK